MSDTQTVTVADAYARRLWEAGTLTINLNQGVGTITDIYRITNGFRVHMREFVSVRCQAGDTLTYTPHTPAAPPAPDPRDAEIARLREERDAAIEALKPFAAYGKSLHLKRYNSDANEVIVSDIKTVRDGMVTYTPIALTAGDFKRAAALKSNESRS